MEHPSQTLVRKLPGNGLMLAANEICPGGRPTVIFLPGGGQTRYSWSRALRLAGRSGMHGLAVDLRGHGNSDWAADGDYQLDTVASDIIAVVDHLATPSILVGASRGGQAALLTAAARPNLVRSVVVLDVAPGANRAAVDEIRQFMVRSSAGFTNALEAVAALDAYRGQPGSASLAAVERNMRRSTDGLLYWHWDPRVALPAHIDPPRDGILLDEAAAKISVPVLLLHGELSQLVDDRCLAHFRSLTPQLETVEIKGAGHMLTDDQTDIFVDYIQDFIRRTADSIETVGSENGI